MTRDIASRAATVGHHPPCADGESDGELDNARENIPQDPIQLAWMVNQNLSATLIVDDLLHSRRAGTRGGWGRALDVFSRLAHHLLHHPGELDGVGRASSGITTAGFATRHAIALNGRRSSRRVAQGGAVPVRRVDFCVVCADTFHIYSPPDTPQGLGRGSVFSSLQAHLCVAWEVAHVR